MSLLHLPAFLATTFEALAGWLDRRSGARLPALLVGMLLAQGRRTCTSWFRPAGITTEFRHAYTTIHAVGHNVQAMSTTPLSALKPMLGSDRLVVALDDTPTPRYGPEVEGCGIHHNPTPGPAGEEFLYGHLWVTLAAIVPHPQWGTIALPLQALPYVRQVDVEQLPPERRQPFRTKLELAADLLSWLKPWVEGRFQERWSLIDGGYAKRPFLKAARSAGWVIVGRLQKNAALYSLPEPKRPGQRGPAPTYGKARLSLAKRAGQKGGWQQVECVQYGQKLTKTIKTFLATWHPAGGLVRVVLIKEEDGWVAFFCTKPDASAAEILSAAADRGAIENVFKDVKEVWGAGQQQVRNLHSNQACFNMNLWMYTLVEAWAWEQPADSLCDRSDSPWDNQPRRPSHADKRKALKSEVLRAEIEAALAPPLTQEGVRALAERLLEMAA